MPEEDLFKPLYKQHKRISFEDLEDVFDPHCLGQSVDVAGYSLGRQDDTWSCRSLPGLSVVVNTLSVPEQKQLIKESLVDFLESPEHLSNLDAHYQVPRPVHLFDSENSVRAELPTAPPASVRDKLRWITLGGQYNWTTKKYPSYEPGTPGCPHFPESLSKEISSRFGVKPEAAIVNYYCEGNILSPHQDVTELTNADLISISLGCSCIFYIGEKRYGTKPLPIILRSGDIVVMGGSARFAFHGVGRVFGASAPTEICTSSFIKDESFPSWMLDHRININVRQMK